MSSRNHVTLNVAAAGALALLIAGCASTPPPKELVDARRAYTHASDGLAAALTPAELLTAKQALAQAESAYMNAPDAQDTRDLAYIALRKAEIAEADGALAAERRRKADAEHALAQTQADTAKQAKTELSETRQELASERKALSEQKEALTAEQRARLAAEHRASAALESLDKIAALKEEARGLVITLNGAVLFATGQSTLLPIAEDRLQQVARALEDNPEGKIVIEGHTDSVGTQGVNEELSRRRAEAVRDYFVTKGVAADRIRAVGLGSSRPVADNKTPEGRANNRRVEIILEHDHK